MYRTENSARTLLANLSELTRRVAAGYDRLALGDALEQLFLLMAQTNKYIDEKAPWTLGADQKPARVAEILGECLAVLKMLTVFLHPFMPVKTAEMWERLGETTPIAEAAKNGF